MPTIQASEFKARCLALMDEVASKGEVWVVTRNGPPIAELHPYTGGRSGSPFGLHPGVESCGDIIERLEDIEWKALARSLSTRTPCSGWIVTTPRWGRSRGV